MKKILIVNIGTEIGGIEKCLINFLKYLEKKDCKVDLALWKSSGPLYDEIPDFVNILPSPGPGSFSEIRKERNIINLFSKFFKYVMFKVYGKLGCPWKSLKKNKEKYDIAISYCQNGYSPYFLIDNIQANKKYLWYHELNYIGTENNKNIDIKYFEKYDNIICVSEACKNNLIKAFPSLENKFITLYNFYNIDEIKSKADLEPNPFDNVNKNILLTVGRLSPEKGVELAISACVELSNKCDNFVWYWVGDGPERENAEALINKYGLSDKMLFLGNRINPYPFMKFCDVYVQSSLSEAFCTTIIEAKILNKSIVSTDVESVYEQIIQSDFSVITEKNAHSLAVGINKVLCSLSNLVVNYDFDSINDEKSYDAVFFDNKSI